MAYSFFSHDVEYMREALVQARLAFDAGEVPVGALVVSAQGDVIGVGYNQVEVQATQAAHAEIIALRTAAQKGCDWRLDTCTLYVTLQPCMMCWGLICLSRVERVVWGASSDIYGFDPDFEKSKPLYGRSIKSISKGLLKEEIEDLMKLFFEQRRGRK